MSVTVIGFWLRSRARGFESFEYYDRLVSSHALEQEANWLERLYQMDHTSRIPVEKLLEALQGIVALEE